MYVLEMENVVRPNETDASRALALNPVGLFIEPYLISDDIGGNN